MGKICAEVVFFLFLIYNSTKTRFPFLIKFLTHWMIELSFLQAEKVFNQDIYFKRTVKFVGEPMSHLESIASSAVHYIS